MKPILEIQNISKKFNINQEQQPYLSLRDSLSTIFKRKNTKEDFWALNDVSFNVDEGDTIGIIGKNGAGKSTLLKILSKITPPTSGKIISRGRIASLLEVGTGFHAELSGRENVFMNGSILGMRRAEIQKNFDAIVDFAGVEKFIDTPLKHYSSGMQLRLAFAVAAFLQNEILIIDEVLAVGDTDFQKKCLSKMGDISKSGRTILFVSHNIASMKALCKRGILMQKGNLIYNDSMVKTIEKYLLDSSKTITTGEIPANSSSINTNKLRFTKFLMLDKTNNSIDSINYLSDINLFLEIESTIEIIDSLVDIRINTLDGVELIHACNKYNELEKIKIIKGKNSIFCTIKNGLQPGKYTFTIGVHHTNGATLDYVENIFNFDVLNFTAGADSGDYNFNFKLGLVRFESKWEIKN